MIIKIQGIDINYEIIGNGKPIVIVHGYYVDHRLMKACLEPVFSKHEGYKRIYLDLPGMGESSSEKWINNSDKMLNILIDFIKNVIPNENFLIAGQSYGGYLTRGVVNKIPNKIDGALLICPVIIAEHEKRTVPKHTIIYESKDEIKNLTDEEYRYIRSMLVFQNQKTFERSYKEVLIGIELADTEFLEKLQEKGYPFKFNVDKLTTKFKKPTLILLGRQDSIVGYKDAWNILDNFPRATFSVIDMAGHSLQIEQTELFNALVDNWLNRTELPL